MKMLKLILIFVVASLCAGSAFSQDMALNDLFKSFDFDLTWKDEIRLKGPMQGLFVKTGVQVVILPIAKLGAAEELEHAAIRVGYYSASKSKRLHWLFECDAEANGESQIYGIPSKPGGPYSFQPGAEPFGLYIQNQMFNEGYSLDGETVYSQNKANQMVERFGVDIRKARIFPYRIHGQTKTDWFVVAWEASTNNDYQDLVLVIRGVRLIETKKKETKQREPVQGAQFT